MQNTNEVLSREMSSDIVANPQLSRILDLENGLTADERQQLIYSYLSTSRPRNEMVLLLSARGDIKHLFINRTKEKTKENKSANTATTTGTSNEKGMPTANGATNGTGMSSSTKEESGETGQPDSSEDFADVLDEQKRQAAVQNARAELLHDEDASERASDTADRSTADRRSCGRPGCSRRRPRSS